MITGEPIASKLTHKTILLGRITMASPDSNSSPTKDRILKTDPLRLEFVRRVQIVQEQALNMCQMDQKL